MAKSEKAKALEAQQKAAVKAAKQRRKELRKTSTNPADWGQWRQLREVYRMTAADDPQLTPFMLLAGLFGVVLTLVVAYFLGAASGWWVLWAFLALMMGATFALLVLTRRAKSAAFRRHAGQPGSSEVGLSGLNSKKYTRQMAVAFNREMDMVHRVIGPSGVVLVGEGDNARVRAMLDAEVKRHEKVLYGVPVSSLVVGDGPRQVPLADLQKHIEKLPKAIQPAQVTQIAAKMKSLDAVRPKAPLPKGPLPKAKGMQRAMRGR